MTQLRSVKMSVPVEVDPEDLCDQDKAIGRKAASYLLVYSHKVGGVPLAYTVMGTADTGSISWNGGVVVTALLEYVVLKISPGDVMVSVRGMALGVFQVDVDGNEEYDGEFVVGKVVSRGKTSFTVVGSGV